MTFQKALQAYKIKYCQNEFTFTNEIHSKILRFLTIKSIHS